LIFEFDVPTEVNRILLQEYIRLGQRVKNFIVSAEIEGEWKELDGQTTIGYKRILRFDTVKADKIKVQFMDAKGSLAISNIELYRAPNLLTEPVVKRNRAGMVTLEIPDKNVEIYYTLNGSEPTKGSTRYGKPFLVDRPTTVKAIGFDSTSKKKTETVGFYFDVAKKDWEVVHTTTGNIMDAYKLVDDDPGTYWATDKEVRTIQEVIIDMGRIHKLKGFTYWPIQERYPFGIITNFEFYVSKDNRTWRRVIRGEFSNIVNNPIEQRVNFTPTDARFIRLRGIKVDGEDYRTSFAEIGIISN